jgi:glycosyltransferase involved in cell wall biosynthesis
MKQPAATAGDSRRKLRVLHVIPGLEKDGAEYQMALNATLIDRDRFENHVCHLFPRTELKDWIVSRGIQVHSVESHGRLSGITRVRKLVRLVRELKIDIIHGSNVEGELYGGLAGMWSRVPAVATLTNISYEPVWLVDNPNVDRKKLFIVDRARRCVLRRLHTRYVAISEYVLKSAVEGFGLDRRKMALIYRGLPGSTYRPDAVRREATRAALGLAGQYPVLLNVGRLVPQKGQRYLIEAMPEVVKAHPQCRLLIAGEGFLESSLKDLAARLGVADRITFLGRRADVPDLLNAADIYVFPSLFEGFGVALLEAAAMGKPCIASGVGPMPEILDHGNAGLLVPSMDSKELSAAVLRLASDPQFAAQIAAAAETRAREVFDINRSVRQLESFYEQTLSRRAA